MLQGLQQNLQHLLFSPGIFMTNARNPELDDQVLHLLLRCNGQEAMGNVKNKLIVIMQNSFNQI